MTTLDHPAIVHADHRIGAADDRRAIYAAIQAAADENGGMVHIADVRAHLTREVRPSRIGSAICHLVRAGVLVNTAAVRENGGRASRNGTKPAFVRVLIGDLP